MIAIDSAGDGSSTRTIWNRLSSALSVSKYFWYSSKVVEPIVLSSPLASAGLRILEASIAPDERPAPTRVWISSMNRMISPALSTTSLTTPFRRSSNSPWYFAPAIKAPMSNEYTFLLLRFSGTSPSTIFWAMPSEMAVLPTPGSPTSIGLFLVLLLRICRTLRISSSLPMTGSSFPFAACSLRLIANLGKNSNDLLFVLFSIISLLFGLGTLPLTARAGSRDGNKKTVRS